MPNYGQVTEEHEGARIVVRSLKNTRKQENKNRSQVTEEHEGTRIVVRSLKNTREQE